MLRLSKKVNNIGQVMMEFTFSMIIVLLMIWAATQIFRWAGLDLVERRKAHDDVLTDLTLLSQCIASCDTGSGPSCGLNCQENPPHLEPNFYQPIKLNAIWSDPNP